MLSRTFRRHSAHYPSKNFPKPYGAQLLRIRQELRGVSLGPLAVPLPGPSLPPVSLPQVLLESFAIRASRLGEILIARQGPPQARRKFDSPGVIRAEGGLRNPGIPGMGKPGQAFQTQDRVGPFPGIPWISHSEARGGGTNFLLACPNVCGRRRDSSRTSHYA